MKLFLCLIFFIPLQHSCGSSSSYDKPKPAPQTSLVAQTCNTCHGKSIGTAFGDTLPEGAKKRVRNNTMPPGGGLDDTTKQRLLGE